MTDWLDELYQLHEQDKAKRQEEMAQLDLSILGKHRPTSTGILRHSNALNLLRRVQKALLNGKGVIEVFDQKSDYDHALTLVWQGPISAARKPNPNDLEPYQYILVGVKDARLYVNGKEVNPPHPENLKAALVEAAKNPAKSKPNKNSK
jgi:hypothetical protein